jgi:hypothetical protein
LEPKQATTSPPSTDGAATAAARPGGSSRRNSLADEAAATAPMTEAGIEEEPGILPALMRQVRQLPCVLGSGQARACASKQAAFAAIIMFPATSYCNAVFVSIGITHTSCLQVNNVRPVNKLQSRGLTKSLLAQLFLLCHHWSSRFGHHQMSRLSILASS